MTPEEVKTVIDFLIEQKKAGQFRVIWSSFEQAVNLITSKEVHVIDCWEPMVFVARAQGHDAVYAAPKEGYLLWAMAAYMVNNPERSEEDLQATYELLDFMLGPWYGAKITLLRGYMTNPMAPEYAKAHPGGVQRRGGRACRRDHRGRPAQVRAGRHLAEPLADPRRRLRGGVAALQGGLTAALRRAGSCRSRADARRFAWSCSACRCWSIAGLILGPLLITLVVSLCEKKGFWVSPRSRSTPTGCSSPASGSRCSSAASGSRSTSTAIMLLIAYPIAYLVTLRVRPELTRAFLFLFAVPFLVNYIVRTFAWADLLSRTGSVNSPLLGTGLIEQPLDWLLYSDFAVYLGLITAYMPFMIFPIWLSLSGIDRRLLEASWVLGAPPLATFWRVTLPLSLPGVFAAAIFGFVGSFGEVAVSLILGGTGYQLLGNAIASALDVLNYPLAAAISTVATGLMLALLIALVPAVRHAAVPRQDHGAGVMPSPLGAARRSA